MVIGLSDSLKVQYETLFNSCLIDPSKAQTVDQIADRIQANKPRYEQVGLALKTPWYLIGVIHNMEASLSFLTHLHNGDPLTARTTHVPANRPREGTPPFRWEESAIDALRMKSFQKWSDWSVPGILYKLEEYNGWGYRMYHPHVLSPYLWSFSNHYISGKYVQDGTWSATAKSQQAGAATILRRMAERHLIALSANGTSDQENLPDSELEAKIVNLAPLVVFAPTKYSESAAILQQSLNLFPGIFVKVDGFAGEKTSSAFKRLTGHYLKQDPREQDA